MLQVEHSAILSTFIKLPFVIKIFILSIFEWPFYTGFTVLIRLLKVIIKTLNNLAMPPILKKSLVGFSVRPSVS